MSPPYREPTVRALPPVPIRFSLYLGELGFLGGSCWHRAKEQDAECKSASGTRTGSSVLTDSLRGLGWRGSTFSKGQRLQGLSAP